MNILCVEDDVRIQNLLTEALEEEQHYVVAVGDGVRAQQYIASGRFDLAILDLMIPPPDGFEVLRYVRALHITVPVLVLSARSDMRDVVRALDLGADDYMMKPFHFEVLFARLRSLSRRSPVAEAPLLELGGITLDRSRRQATQEGRLLPLTKREYLLLESLMRNAGRSVTRERLIETVWGLEANVTHGSLDFQMHGLRGKLTANESRPLIRTVRGVGYRMEE